MVSASFQGKPSARSGRVGDRCGGRKAPSGDRGDRLSPVRDDHRQGPALRCGAPIRQAATEHDVSDCAVSHCSVIWYQLTACSVTLKYLEGNAVQSTILEAAGQVLRTHGLNKWTVDLVAERAGCAKGLVNYHHGSKTELLSRTAAAVRTARLANWVGALANAKGTAALDALWTELCREVDEGWFRAWLALLSSGGEPAREAAIGGEDLDRIGRFLEDALEVPPDEVPDPGLVTALLDGCALRLVQNQPKEEVREAFDRFWLRVIEG